MTVIFAILQVHPFATGKNMILTVDCYHQYAPFLVELRNKILSGESLFFSWHVGMGTNFWAVFANYSASPLNILCVFFPAKYISDCIAFLAIIRCGLTGLFMSYLLPEFDKKRKDLFLTAFASFYALCGWAISYFWNIMWHDAVVLLPLIVLGLLKMFRDKKPLLYCCSLTICLISNFYSGYFVCLFLVFYAPILYVTITEKVTLKNFWSAVWRFGVYSGLAGGLSAFLTLSTYITLQKSSATSGTFSCAAFSMASRRISAARSASSGGHSSSSSSCTCRIRRLCIPASRSALSVRTIASLIMSAAVPCTGVFMAARLPNSRIGAFGLFSSGRYRRRPIIVRA